MARDASPHAKDISQTPAPVAEVRRSHVLLPGWVGGCVAYTQHTVQARLVVTLYDSHWTIAESSRQGEHKCWRIGGPKDAIAIVRRRERNGQVLTLQAIDPIAQRSRRPANFSVLDWLTVERTAIGHTFKGR